MKRLVFAFWCIVAMAGTQATAGDTNVLLIGSTRQFGGVQGVQASKKEELVNLVRKSLLRELRLRGKINVVFEEIYRGKKMDVAVGGGGQPWNTLFARHSLAQWYFWPDGIKERMADLTGKGETKYNYVVLVGDAYLLSNMPGVYAEGVNLIANKVSEGKAKTVLLVPWGTKIGKELTAMSEVICRVGKGARLSVIPKAVASKMAKRCAGIYESENPFTMKYVDKRKVTYHHTGSSSERGIEGGLKRAAQACNVDMRKTAPKNGVKVDFNYGRANSTFEKNKRYKVEPKSYHRSYGFPMQDHSKTAAETMLLGIDRRSDDGTDLGIALDMIQLKEVQHDIRCIPIRLMWAKMHELDPEMKPLRDRWHMSSYLDSATGAYMYTLLSGRCPMNDKPAAGNNAAMGHWLGQKVGYETAWRMNHLNERVPGFKVRPQNQNSDLTAQSSSIFDVKLHYAPKSDVTVTITLDNPAAGTVSPTTLTFTAKNHTAAQTVTVTGKAVEEDTPFKVSFVTTSKDTVFTKLKDSWSFTTKAPPKAK